MNGQEDKDGRVRKGRVIISIVVIFVLVAVTFGVWYLSPKDTVSYSVISAQTPWGWYYWLDERIDFVQQVKTENQTYIIHYWKPTTGLWGREDVKVTFDGRMQFVTIHLILEKKMWIEINTSNIGGKIDLYLPELGVV